MDVILNEARQYLMPTRATVAKNKSLVLEDIEWLYSFPDIDKFDLRHFISLKPLTLRRQ